ncbi:MAG TPA: heme o synthase [Candidatus Saccharimonadia bacterium]|nr:heme o synthase [Candidatus Saccharimonadia bacterium]
MSVSTYYRLAKPGIIYGNCLTTLGGFLLAAQGKINWLELVATLVGLGLVIGCACVINNYADRDIDKHMARTKKRALVTGAVTGRAAAIYAAGLGATGFAILAAFTNLLTVGLALLGLVFYVPIYTYTKRVSVHGTLVGSVSGAVPVVVGYCAVTNRFDLGALLLFVIMTVWQMPHFYAIAIYRLSDYQAAKIPVLPAVSGVRAAKVQMLVYIAAFVLAVVALPLGGFAGYTFGVVMGLLGLRWLWLGIQGFSAKDSVVWAKGLFKFSLIVLLVFSAMLSVDWLLP